MKEAATIFQKKSAPSIGDFQIMAINEDGEAGILDETTIGNFGGPVIMCAVPGRMSRATVARFLHMLADEIGASGSVN